MLLHLQSAFGICVIVVAAWALSEDRRAFPWRTVAAGLVLQAALALFLLKVGMARDGLLALNGAVDALTGATRAGTSFVFGFVGGGAAPFAVTNPAGMVSFAFGILPLVIVISALSALLWHWRILPVIVKAFAFALRKLMGIGGAVGLGAAATIFLGMVEAPLLIRPYLSRLSRGELFILMTVGLASVAGTVFFLYASILKDVVPGALGHILIASMMSLPSAILVARIMIPGEGGVATTSASDLKYRSSMDAVARGTEDGLKIYLQILAMLIVMVALVALADTILRSLPPVWGAPLSLERMFGWLFAPVVWLFGVPADQAATAGSLMGTKTILNELVAYLNLAALPKGALDPRSTLIMIYAMCGFANLGSVGIMIAGMSTLMPERRDEIVPLAMRAIVSGTMASGLTGAMIGLLPVI
ncbi:MAG TPA: nucleoside transporter C-terminal domain-containing protein [Rhizomicrobium sp.]|nr:nucleoside transporter C-terminal domain-containing protein [Rhizomicrobium sp.]